MAIWYLDPVNGVDNVLDLVNPKRLIEVTTPAVIDATHPKHGLYCLNTSLGNVSANASSANDVGLLFGAEQFTIEVSVWFNTHSATAEEVILSHGYTWGGTSNIGWWIGMTTTGKLAFVYSLNGTTKTEISGAYTPPTNANVDITVERDASGVIRVMADGVIIASATQASALFNTTAKIFFGNEAGQSKRFPGMISGVRVTKGWTRYGDAYTPSGLPFGRNATDDPAFAYVTMLIVFAQRGDGSSFEDRCRTIQYGLVSRTAKPVAGDEIRFIKSPDPSLVGDVAWTSGSRLLTLPAAVTQTIDNCDVAWTGSTNVTSTLNTTSRKEGAGFANISVAAGFTTGKIAYRTLPSALNLSAYQQVSMWLRASTAIVAGSAEIRLCSDTLGDVPVHVIPLDQTAVANAWRVLTKDFAANLSSSIASVSLWGISDFGACVISLDNLIACLPTSNPAALTHLSLVGKKTTAEPEWYPILSIDGTALYLGGEATATIDGNTARNYLGVSETVATYRLQPLDPISGRAASGGWTSTANIISGTDASPLKWSGGWDATDMSTQTGETWLTGAHWKGSAFGLNCSYNRHEKIGYAHFYQSPLSITATSVANYFQTPGIVGCGGVNIVGFNQSLELDLGNVVGCLTYGLQSVSTSEGRLVARARRITGCYNNFSGIGVKAGAYNGWDHHFYIDLIDNNDSQGLAPTSNLGKLFFYQPTIRDNRAWDFYAGVQMGDTTLVRPTLAIATTSVTGNGSFGSDVLRLQGLNGDPNDHRNMAPLWSVASDTAIKHAATGYSWKLTGSSGSRANTLCPLSMPLAKIEVVANAPVTVLCWARRDSGTLPAGLMVRGGAIAGVSTDAKSVIAAAANTWEQTALTFTPTQDGVIELLGYVAGPGSAWFNEISVA